MKKLIISVLALMIMISANAQKKEDIKCRIWKPKSYCDIPDSLTGIQNMNCIVCSMKGISCSQIDKMGFITAVWLTIPRSYGESFSLRTGFKNISLVKKNNGDAIHPRAIATSFNYSNANTKERKTVNVEYLSDECSMQRLKYSMGNNKKLDLILIFPHAEKGDKVIIDGYIEAEIK